MSSTAKIWLITGKCLRRRVCANESTVHCYLGASSGFGRCLITEILGRGDRVIATSRSLASLRALEGTDANLRLLQLDVTDGPDIIKAKMAEAINFFGGLDVLVNNAGANFTGILEEGGSAFLRKQFDVCVFGVMDVTTAALPYLRAKRDGTVVIIGSRSAWIPEFPGIGSYASSKAAVHALAEAFSGELAHLNIRVLLVEPSAFRTSMINAEGFFDGLKRKDGIPDYDSPRNRTLDLFNSFPPPSGDPVKAMAAVVDVVRQEGVAVGKPWPTYLVLGRDAEKAILAKTDKLKSHLTEWAEVVRGVEFEADL
ncbi:putative oxidoreductase YusZ [Mycena venus]|uniref:Putative oxidoreductase YusZ n=1 Tax=Mycena venus TaxID=2733690 RepID=A0A8H6Y8U9_9AGAR|nr:putative oxidoreductase YusZ [Mycena venus]